MDSNKFIKDLLLLRLAYMRAEYKVFENKSKFSKEMYRLIQESLQAAFRLQKARLISYDEDRLNLSLQLFDEEIKLSHELENTASYLWEFDDFVETDDAFHPYLRNLIPMSDFLDSEEITELFKEYLNPEETENVEDDERSKTAEASN